MKVREAVSYLPFAVVGGTHVAAKLLPHRALDRATKPFLMPLLGIRLLVARRRIPRLLLGSMALSWIGDLTIDRSFRTGLAAFLLGHVLLVALLWRGMRGRLSPWSLLLIPWVIFDVVVMRPRSGVLFPAIVGYALVLAAMATSAGRGNRRTRVGAVLFVVSDTTLALRQFTPWLRSHRWGAVVMATYIAAQALLVDGVTD
ncbi:hypothetical protein BH11ACT3_BH11ACT3_10980 [soil metagenome]